MEEMNSERDKEAMFSQNSSVISARNVERATRKQPRTNMSCSTEHEIDEIKPSSNQFEDLIGAYQQLLVNATERSLSDLRALLGELKALGDELESDLNNANSEIDELRSKAIRP